MGIYSHWMKIVCLSCTICRAQNLLNSSIIFNLWQFFFLLWHSIFKFCFHYFILFRFIKFWHISVESVASWQLVAALFDSFLCVFVSMLASQMKWFSVAYSAKSTKSYICNFNFHPFVMVVNSTIFPPSFSPMNE